MDRLKELLGEIHRRSLWQVLGLYLVVSWGVLNAVDVLTGFAGLPEWTPTMAVVLLLVGLPIVMATAVIQRGLPGAHGVESGPVTPTGSGSDSVEVPEDRARAGAGLFTWKNAVFGGVLAGLLLVIAVSAYLLMWATGVGPVGSLVAQGVLDERDPVMLAEFESRDDEGLGSVVSDALAVDLSQSRTVTLLGRDAVRATLGMMGREPDEALTESLAREVAVRANVKAVIAGEVTRVGTRYLLVARILDPDTGSDLVSFREEGAGDDDLLPAIDRLSARLREKMGESLRTIRLGTPLEQATTSSLEALRKLTEAERAEEEGRYENALRLLDEAVALDSAFAQAHRKIAVLLANTGADEAAVVEASSLAYRYRDRLTDRERYLAEANYHSNVTGDDDAVIRAYEAALAVNPDESAALNNLSNVFRKRARFDEARKLLERAVAGPGASSVASSNLVRVRLALGDLPGAREAAEAYRDRYTGHIFIPWIDMLLAAATDEADAVHTLANAIESDPSLGLLHPQLPRIRIAADAHEGRLREALDHSSAIEDVRLLVFQQVLNAPLGAPDVFLWLLDDSAAAVAAVPDVLERVGFDEWSHDRPEWRFPIVTLALAGDPDAAVALYDRWTEGADPSELPPGSRDIARAMIELAGGRAEEALALVEQAAVELGCQRCVEVETALIYEGLGRTSDAIAIWERVRATPLDPEAAPWERIVAIKRLGPLYEEVADTAGALAAYEALVEAWADADPELQPQVDAARARIAALGG